MPTTRTLLAVALGSAALAASAGAACGYTVGSRRADAPRDVLVSMPPGKDRVAFVREAPCGEGRCQTLWLGRSTDEATEVASLGGSQKTDAFYYGGIRDVREARLRSGHRIVGTPNHRLLVAGQGQL